MKRWTVLGAVVMFVGLLTSCGLLNTVTGGDPSGAGAAVSTVGGIVAGANPLVGLILTLVGGGLTAVGEYKKTQEGR